MNKPILKFVDFMVFGELPPYRLFWFDEIKVEFPSMDYAGLYWDTSYNNLETKIEKWLYAEVS